MTEKTSPLIERDCVLLSLGDKNRPAVVLAILNDDNARVIYGTGTRLVVERNVSPR